MVKKNSVKRFGGKKDKRGKPGKKNKAKEKRKEKMMHFGYEKVGSDNEMQEHEDLMKFGKFHP
jgi:hypothetical protein